MNSMKSNNEEWAKLSKIFKKISNESNFDKLVAFRRVADLAKGVINGNEGLKKMDFTITIEEAYEFISLTNRLGAYSKGIHGEIVDKIDTPFFRQMEGFTELVYSLNPEDVDVDIGEHLAINVDSLIENVRMDNYLAWNYNELIDSLNKDEPSEDLKKILDEDLFKWREEFSYEEVKEIDRKLYAVDNEVSHLYYDMAPDMAIKSSNYEPASEDDSGAFFVIEDGGGIYYNKEEDRNNIRGKDSSFLHEMGHMIDYKYNEKNTGKLEKSYSSTSKYSDEFYKNLLNDADNYVSNFDENYNAKHGTHYWWLTKDKIIYDETKRPEMMEVADIVDGSTFWYQTGFGHDYSYWDRNYLVGSASKEKLNGEAFAHFTQMSINQNEEDLQSLKEIFPNAYETYLKMVKEMR